MKVRLNQYAPGAEYRRLFRNKSVGAGWRYTIGLISVTFYTIVPGRFFAGLVGGDNYNPYTNTINLYSDHVSVALHEGGHGKDFAETNHKGTYAAARLLPLVPLVQEAYATGDAIGYHRWKGLTEEEKADYKSLYPAYGTYVGGEVLRWVPVGWVVSYSLTAASAIPGHIAGRIKAAHVEEKPSSKTTVTPPLPSPSREPGYAPSY